MIKVYLMCPYSHPEYFVRQYRVNLADRVAAWLMLQGHVVYSPLSHSHRIAHHLNNHLEHDFWLRQCHPFVEWADEARVIMAEGWNISTGIKLELEWLADMGKPFEYIDPDDI